MDVAALDIPIIIKAISSFLPLGDLIRCRLINKEWNATLINVLAIRKNNNFVLKLPMMHSKHGITHHHFYLSRSDYIDKLFMEMDPRLVSRIKLCQTSPITIFPDTINKEYDTVENFLELHQSHIQSFDVFVGRELWDYVTAIFRTFPFPFINKIRIVENNESEFYRSSRSYKTSSFGLPKFPRHPNLQSVEYEMQSDENANVGVNVYQSLASGLIQSAGPALEVLKIAIVDSFYPDLRNCTSLKKLSLAYANECQWGREFNETIVAGILNMVKHSLEDLHLSKRTLPTAAYGFYYGNSVLAVPVFDKLKILNLMAVDLYNISARLSSTYFPKLERIALGATAFYEPILDDFLDSVDEDVRLGTVTELTLAGVSNLSSITNAKRIFPNVKILVLMIGIGHQDDDDDNANEADDSNITDEDNILNNDDDSNDDEEEDEPVNHLLQLPGLFESLEEWNIKGFGLIIQNHWDLFNVLGALPFLSIEGMDVLKIIFWTKQVNDSTTLPDDVKQGLLATRGLKTFEVTLQEMIPQLELLKKFAADKHLIISFAARKIVK